jgi:sigma-B regulation protein RsbU (phosphoserine phosphatase)
LTTIFNNGIDTAQNVTIFFVIVLWLLLLGELVSLVIGISLTRTITQAVHGLYQGTSQIAKGDFAWRIPVKGSDQLAELGRSFNNMTTQIENLVIIAKEKERLQSEVEIAGEVQNQLFPRSAPAMRTIELIGVCQAARMVSGDYYDYLCLPDGNLALAIGDVAGKGISAALLMASIQSIMRTQLAAGLARSAAAGNGRTGAHISTSSMVAQLNRQLYASTAPEKYATFFFGVYDEFSRILTYTNAGHLQPLLLRGGRSQMLDVTGTVVGLFPVINYEEQTVEIHPGDLLIAYTDGITEPENAYGEEFGVDRLTETVLRYQNTEPKEVVARIMEAVANWSTASELPDDMTVVLARGLA